MRNSPVRRPSRSHFFTGSSPRLIVIFSVFILLPGIFLGVFALQVLRQGGQLGRQRTRERMERTAAEIGRDIGSEFRRLEEIVQMTAREGEVDAASFLEVGGQALEQPGCGAILFVSKEGLEMSPTGALLFMPAHEPELQIPPIRLPAELAEAESLEIGRQEYGRAIRVYRNLLNSIDVELRPLLLQRLARTLRKSGSIEEAALTYQDLEQLNPVSIDGLPSDLIARSELCALAAERGDEAELASRALALYRDLVAGIWPIQRPRYLYYSDRCRSWCRDSRIDTGEFKQLRKTEERKLSLSYAIEELLNEPRRVISKEAEVHIAFWHADPFTAMIISSSFLGSHWWPKITAAQGKDLDAVLYSPDGHAVIGDIPAETPPFAVMHEVRIDESPWLLQVWPRQPAAIYADMRQRQILSLAMLVFVVALLVFGSYITVRTVKRELEIARMRADFVSTVSHEFRSPLTGIRHLGEMLLDGRATDKEKQRDYYRMIVRESDRLTRLVENILDFSRMEEGRKEYRFVSMNTSLWLRKLTADFEAEIAETGVEVITRIPDGLPPISADPEALGSAVRNLLDNAVKYSPGRKATWLDAEAASGEVKISVKDRGIGISEQEQQHIFDRFYRADGEASRRIKGAGLGLSLVKHIVTAHGGTVECESKVNEGSTFSIRLPLEKVTGGS